MVEYKPVTGKDFYNDLFYAGGRLKPEAVIESRVNRAHEMATTFAITVDKEDGPIRGHTDGLITFRTEKKEIKFVQELKRGIKNRNTKAYKYQVIQNLLYAFQFDDTDGILIASENYMDTLLIEDLKMIDRKEFLKILEEYPPSVACKKVDLDISSLPITKRDMPDANITNMWQSIDNHFNNI